MKWTIFASAMLLSSGAWAACSNGAPISWPMENGNIRAIHGCKYDGRTTTCKNGFDFQVQGNVIAACTGILTPITKDTCGMSASQWEQSFLKGENKVCQATLKCDNGLNLELNTTGPMPGPGRVTKNQPIVAAGSKTLLNLKICETTDKQGRCVGNGLSTQDPLDFLDRCETNFIKKAQDMSAQLQLGNMCKPGEECNFNPVRENLPQIPCNKTMDLCLSDYLFDKYPLSDVERKDILSTLPLQWSAVGPLDKVCGEPTRFRYTPVDLNDDGFQELVITEGNTCSAGMAGGKNHFFRKFADGKWRKFLEGAGDPLDPQPFGVLNEKANGWKLIVPSTRSLCEKVYGYSPEAKTFVVVRKVASPTNPNACEGQ